jgi:drug/metabolite transporter (DMT)-like permease
LTPVQYLYFRFLVAGICASPIFIWYCIKDKPKISYLIKVVLIELLGTAVPLYLLYQGLSMTSALQASLIGSTGPIFIVIGGIIFLHERENKREWQGLAISTLGSLLLVAEPLLTHTGHDTPMSSVGNLFIMGYNLVYTVYAIIAKKVYKSKPPLFVGSLIYMSTAFIYALLLIYQRSLPSLALLFHPQVIVPVLYMAIPGSILAFGLYLYAMAKIEISEENLFTYLNGVIAIPAAYLILGEVPTVFTIISTLIIALGVYRAESRRSTH